MWGRESLFVRQSIPLNGKSETFLFDAVLWFRFVKFFPILLLAFRLFFLLFFLSSIPSLFSTLWAQFWCLRRTFRESTYSTHSTIISWVSCCSCCRRLYIQAHLQFSAFLQIYTPLFQIYCHSLKNCYFEIKAMFPLHQTHDIIRSIICEIPQES